jgi:hypothetical protein
MNLQILKTSKTGAPAKADAPVIFTATASWLAADAIELCCSSDGPNSSERTRSQLGYGGTDIRIDSIHCG